MDQWLPEQEKQQKDNLKEQKSELGDEDDREDEREKEEIGERDPTEEGIFRMEEDDEIMESKESEMNDDSSILSSSFGLQERGKPRQELLRGGSSNSNNSHLTKQLLRTVPTTIIDLTILPWTFIHHLGSELRHLLSRGSPSWFTRVDDVLLQNNVVRAISQGVIRPAEHFFNTAVDIFRSYYREVDIFLVHLKKKLGSTWDERLITYSKSFFNLAVDLKKSYQKDKGSLSEISSSGVSSSSSS